jgi:hypothetical protein
MRRAQKFANPGNDQKDRFQRDDHRNDTESLQRNVDAIGEQLAVFTSRDGSAVSTSSEYIDISMFLEILERKDFVPALIPVSKAVAIFNRTAQVRIYRDGSKSAGKVLSEDQVLLVWHA